MYNRADQFDVPVPFLLQQAAWLYEHQLSTVRAQMQRISTSRPTSMVGGPETLLTLHARGKSSLDETNHSGSGSGSGTSLTVKGSQTGSGRGSFRGSAATLAQTRSALNSIRPGQGMCIHCDNLEMPLILHRNTKDLPENRCGASSRRGLGTDGENKNTK